MQAHRQQRQQRQHSTRPNSIKQRGSLCDTISAGGICSQLVHREQQQMQQTNTAHRNWRGYVKRALDYQQQRHYIGAARFCGALPLYNHVKQQLKQQQH
jgi:hypothetical protein